MTQSSLTDLVRILKLVCTVCGYERETLDVPAQTDGWFTCARDHPPEQLQVVGSYSMRATDLARED